MQPYRATRHFEDYKKTKQMTRLNIVSMLHMLQNMHGFQSQLQIMAAKAIVFGLSTS